MYYQGLINRYKEYLPVTETTPIVTLNEGDRKSVGRERVC